MWDRFGWGPDQTRNLTFRQTKELFTVLEQQRVTKDAVENLGKPTPERHEQLLAERSAQAEMSRSMQGKG